MSSFVENTSANRDKVRGIHNIRTEERFVHTKNMQTMQSKLRTGIQFKKQQTNSFIDGVEETPQKLYAPHMTQTPDYEQVYKDNIPSTHALTKKSTSLKKSNSFKVIGLLGAYAYIQFVFALMSALGFGLEIIKTDAMESSWFTKLIGSSVGAIRDSIQYFTNFDIGILVPFELIGWTCLAVVCLLTLAISIGYSLFFTQQGVDVFDSAVSILVFTILFSLNIFPFINIFPWIELLLLIVVLTHTKKTMRASR
jgi:hypothetical protein